MTKIAKVKYLLCIYSTECLPAFIPWNGFPRTNWIIQRTNTKQWDCHSLHITSRASPSVVSIYSLNEEKCYQERKVILTAFVYYFLRVCTRMTERGMHLDFGSNTSGIFIEIPNCARLLMHKGPTKHKTLVSNEKWIILIIYNNTL